MPRPPQHSPSLQAIPGAVYSALAERLKSQPGEVYPFHVGDTWMDPPAGCHIEDQHTAELPGLHRYTQVQGLPKLLDTVLERARARTGVREERENLLITNGATGGLAAIVGALLAPEDEVLLLAPHWPLISGIVSSFHGKPVRVSTLGVKSAEELVAEVRRHSTSRTVALYLNTPCNPTGQVFPPAWVEALAEEARRQNLWLISDEVYEDYVYEGAHCYARRLAPERTFSAYSFSKAYGMAGNRCGYSLGPAEAMRAVLKVSTHTYYSAPTASQWAAQRALLGPGPEWAAKAAAQYRATGTEAAKRLGVPPPQGSTFLFLDLSRFTEATGLEEEQRSLAPLLERCADRGLLLAPGSSFGPYPLHARLCFTCAPPDVVLRGVEVLRDVLRIA